MNVVIYSPAFPPQIGGLEEIARICAQGLTELGHEVTVICETPDDPPTKFPFRVLRRIAFSAMMKAFRQCDVCLMFNMNLKALWMPVLLRKPLVICHQGWYGRDRNDLDLRARVKIALSRLLASNVACSRAVADYIGKSTGVIPNAYNDRLFFPRPEITRDRDVLFVGRLVSDKGAALLVDAIARLAVEGLHPSLTITGAGPEEAPLRQQVAALGLTNQVNFTGPLRGESLAIEMNRHRILVVPSLWEEPFGIVAVEGIASGCMVIGSRKGGLADAIGECGLLFENGSVVGLLEMIKQAIVAPAKLEKLNGSRQMHLKMHHSTTVAVEYEKYLRSHCQNRHDKNIPPPNS